MLVFRSDDTLPLAAVEQLRDQVNRAAKGWLGLCEVYVYGVGPDAPDRGTELVVRVSAGDTVVPLLFHAADVPTERVFASVRGVLATVV